MRLVLAPDTISNQTHPYSVSGARVGHQRGSRHVSLSIESIVSPFKHLSQGQKQIVLRGCRFGSLVLNAAILHSSTQFQHQSLFSSLYLSLTHTLFPMPVGLLLFEELCWLSNLSPRWVLIKLNWAELSWHCRDRQNSCFFSLRLWVTISLKDRKMDYRSKAIFRVGLSVCNEDLMPSNMEPDGAQTAAPIWGQCVLNFPFFRWCDMQFHMSIDIFNPNICVKMSLIQYISVHFI